MQNVEKDKSYEMTNSPGRLRALSKNEAARGNNQREKCRVGPVQEDENFLSTLKVTVSKIHLLCPSQNVNAGSYPCENLEQFCGSK